MMRASFHASKLLTPSWQVSELLALQQGAWHSKKVFIFF
jgi:hypothetical protein